MIKNFEALFERIKETRPVSMAVAQADDRAVLEAVKNARDRGFIEPLLVGSAEKLGGLLEELDFKDVSVTDAQTPEQAVSEAVALARTGKAGALMKGLVNTSIFMRGVLDKECGLRAGRLLSMLAVYEAPNYHKLLFCSDSGINVAPNLEQKKEILINVLDALDKIGLTEPKVAVLTANELPDPKIPSTTDAAALVEMVQRGEIPSCSIEGPIAFDVAFDPEAAAHKSIQSKISGDVDVLIFPNIEAGNILGKSWIHLNHSKWAGIVLGALCPIVLGSRSDTPEIKLGSIALACLSASKRRRCSAVGHV